KGFAKADLRYKTAVGAKVIAVIVVDKAPVVASDLMTPGKCARPCIGAFAGKEGRLLRIFCIAIKDLPSNDIGVGGPPLTIGSKYAVVSAARNFAIRKHETGKRYAEIVANTSQCHVRFKVLRCKEREIWTRNDNESAAVILRVQDRVGCASG